MLRLTALALLMILVVSSPAMAQIGDDLGSEQQTEGYGRLFGFVCGAAALITIIIVGAHVVRGMVQEGQRGKKPGWMPEAVLDEAPKKARKEPVLYLGEKVPDWKIANRLSATTAALKFFSRKDDWFDQKNIATIVEKAFRTVKAAIEERSAKKVERLVTAKCLEGLEDEMQKLKKRGERRLFGKLEITDIQVIHVEAPAAKQNHTFTALISVKSKDFYQDEKSHEIVRGDKKVYIYQEFWRFRRSKERWLVDRIRSSSDMDRVLEPKNVMSQSDLDKFAKLANPDHVREFVVK